MQAKQDRRPRRVTTILASNDGRIVVFEHTVEWSVGRVVDALVKHWLPDLERGDPAAVRAFEAMMAQVEEDGESEPEPEQWFDIETPFRRREGS
jgi:hypothetical protein